MIIEKLFNDSPYYPTLIMSDAIEKRRIYQELKSINQTLKVIRENADQSLKRSRLLHFPKTVSCNLNIIDLLVAKTLVFDMDETLVKIQKRNYKLPFFD